MAGVKWGIFIWNPKLTMDEQTKFIVKGDKVKLRSEDYAIYEVVDVTDSTIKIQHLNALTKGDIKDICPSEVCMLLECGL